MTRGPDGAVWFAEFQGNRIGRISRRGRIREFELPKADAQPDQITLGPDGAIWFTEQGADKIGRLAVRR